MVRSLDCVKPSPSPLLLAVLAKADLSVENGVSLAADIGDARCDAC